MGGSEGAEQDEPAGSAGGELHCSRGGCATAVPAERVARLSSGNRGQAGRHGCSSPVTLRRRWLAGCGRQLPDRLVLACELCPSPKASKPPAAAVDGHLPLRWPLRSVATSTWWWIRRAVAKALAAERGRGASENVDAAISDEIAALDPLERAVKVRPGWSAAR